MSLCLLHAEVPCILQCDKKGHASKKLGTNSVGLASELSLVSKLLRKVIPKEFVRSGVYYDIPLIIVSGLEMSLISGDVRSLNWLPIKDRLKLNDATMVFKCINNLAPDYLANEFELRSCVHDRQTRSASTLENSTHFSRNTTMLSDMQMLLVLYL